MDGVQSLKLQNVEQSLDKIYTFLVPCLPLANAHATDFITNNYWDTLLPAGIREQLMTLSKQELGNLPCHLLKIRNKQDVEESNFTEKQTKHVEDSDIAKGRDITQTEHVKIDKCDGKEFSCKQNSDLASGASKSEDTQIPYMNIDDFLQDACLSTIEGTRVVIATQDVLHGIKGDNDDAFVGTYMNQKKCHEVEIMSKICAALAQCSKCKMVVDFGSGKGYLGNHLSLQYKLPVLGIDAASTNTQSALKRNTVLDKQWSSLARNKQLESDGKKMTKKEKKKLKLNKQYRQNNEIKTENKKEYLVAGETNNVVDNGTKIDNIVKANAVIKSDSSEKIFDFSRINIGETDNALNEVRFVPCTTFIDKETNFINLAKVNFPDLFIDDFKDKHEQSLTDNFCYKRYVSSGTTFLNSPSEKSNKCYKRSSDVDKYSNSWSDGNNSRVYSCCKTTDIIDDKRTENYPDDNNACTICNGDNFADISNTDKSETFENKFDEGKPDSCGACEDTITADVSKSGENKTDISKTGENSKIGENKAYVSRFGENKTNISKTGENKADVSKTGENKAYVSRSGENKTDVSNEFRMMLTGLHTCGDLASTSMEMFVHSDQLKVLCNVGCCYHLIHEKYLDEDSGSSQSGFPLSRFLNERQFKLGNTARNLASQSIHRISDFDKLQGERFYPRALLEVLIKHECGDNVEMKGLRKLEQKCQTTQEYIRRACDKLGLSDKVTDAMIDDYIRNYSTEQHKLAAFFQLKAALAPCIESLIILDRVCYLLEQDGIENVFLVKMFDPVKSPRCHGIIAIK